MTRHANSIESASFGQRRTSPCDVCKFTCILDGDIDFCAMYDESAELQCD